MAGLSAQKLPGVQPNDYKYQGLTPVRHDTGTTRL
jgi:hypothetical protein